MSRSDGDIEFFDLLPTIDSSAPNDVLDVTPSRSPGRWAVGGVLTLGLLAAVVFAVESHRPGPDAAPSPPSLLPAWVTAPEPSGTGPRAAQPGDHCRYGSTSVRSAEATDLTQALAAHLSGFTVDRAVRLVDEHGALCTGYLRAHDANGVTVWLLAAAPSNDHDPGMDSVDYGPAERPVHSVVVVTDDLAEVSVLAQGPSFLTPSAPELTRLAIDPLVLR